MATLTESEVIEVIKNNPIGEGLHAFRDVFQSTFAGLSTSSDRVQQIIDRGAGALRAGDGCRSRWPVLWHLSKESLTEGAPKWNSRAAPSLFFYRDCDWSI